jgi:glycosyltransferase involved in cell wall biosynthesis
MKIVIIDTTLTTPPTGGAHTFLVDFCLRLVQQGHATSVVTQPGPDQSLIQVLERGGVEVRSDLWRPSHLPEERASLLANWVHTREIDVYIVSASPDVGWLALPLLAPHVATLSVAHNDNSAFYEPLTHYHSFIDIAVAVSAEIQRKIIAGGIPPERVRQIPYGVASLSKPNIEDRCSQPRDSRLPLNIGYIGRVVQEQKRVMDLVPLAVNLKRRGVLFQLHIIGDGSDRDQLSKAFAAGEAEDCVKFWGWQPAERVKDLLRQMDVFLLMSEYEGLPVALLEAMGHGLAPVVSRIASGNAQLIRDEENGYLVEVGDIMGFADRLEHLSANSSLLRRIQRAAWDTSQEYDIARMVDRYLQCFEDAAAARFSHEYRLRSGGSYPPMPSCVSRYPFWLRKIRYQFRSWGA